MKKYILAILLVVLLSGWSGSLDVYAADSMYGDDEILIGLIPELNIFKQMERYRPLAEYISERLGVKIRLTILSKYGDVIDRFNSRRMDGAFFGDLTTVIAYEKLGVIPVVSVVNTDNSIFVRGHIIVRRDSGIKSARDMKGKVVAFADKASVSGYLFALSYLRKNGVRDISSFFSEIFFTGSYDASVYAVLDGRADVGCVNDTVLREMIRNDPTIDREIQIIATSPEIPGITLCLRRDIPSELRKSMYDILTGMPRNTREKKILDRFGAAGFMKASMGHFKPVYRMLEDIGTGVKNYNYRIK